MPLARDGSFTYTIEAKHLAKGLRPSVNVSRNSKFLSICEGAVGSDYALKTLNELSNIDLDSLGCSFPYPQIFVFSNVTIICTEDSVYELVGSSPVLKLTVASGSPWTAVDFFDFIYLSNNRVSVQRDAGSFVYSVSAASYGAAGLPVTRSICNYNGQLIIENNLRGL
jgi:hypothetical protein